MVEGATSDLAPPAAVKVFSAGTAGCVADLVTFPLDTAKVRLQIQGESRPLVKGQRAKYSGVFGTIVTIVKAEGPKGLYNGLVAGLQRQMSFASVRIGLYDTMKQFYAGGSENAGLGTRMLAGCTTGAMAVAFAQPTDVVKVRFQAQVGRPEAGSVKRYSSTTEAYRTIARDEGFKGLWKGLPELWLAWPAGTRQLHQESHRPTWPGSLPNIIRNAIVNCSELVTYDMIKELLLKNSLMKDDVPCHFTAGFAAGFCTTIVASPVDVVKTRFMNSVPGQYGGAMNCALTMLIREGPSAFYKGFVPSFLRLGSWNIVMFVSYEQFKRAVAGLQRAWESPLRPV
ncbi:dicarboxylate carrier SLC25A8-like isoform X1 [Cololabis saira]|uniref:dicarboxylate carrier SLC25A8-like isoform X1 n=1 Tax=Cololabis saira TaxID=129043 RepID=UPI002AD3676D|nr:dicarboxylate carrier SLC25A8-like isoform X1 [Cololabis saira]